MAEKVLYQSPNYRPERIVDRYLHIDLGTGKPVISEVGENRLTYRSYELPESEFTRYSMAISDAEKIKTHFPYSVKLEANQEEQSSG